MFENRFGKKMTAQGAVISIEPLSEHIHFCTMSDDQSTLVTNTVNYRPRAFDQEFYDRLARQLRQQQEKNPNMDLQRAALILPDQLFLMDTVSIPVIHRKAMQNSLSLAIEAIYKNADELNLVTYSVQQTKQYATFGLAGVRRDLVENVRKTFSDCGISVSGISFASNAMVNGAFALNPKLRSESFLLMDIKEEYTRFAFVIRGCTMGYYDLPFGHGMLHKSRVAAEDLLFDHRAGELLVLNAKEQARAKQLTMEGIAPEPKEEGEQFYEPGIDGNGRRAARKLPKFMQRPTPQTRNEFVYENFRLYIKWTLELLRNNSTITSLAKLDKVYVNMPEEYGFLFDIVNKNKEQHGVSFLPLVADLPDGGFAENLELYGGFFLNQYNEANTF